jgi:hypothetical protein
MKQPEGVFGAIGLAAATLGLFTRGACLGRNRSGGASIAKHVLGFLCAIGLNFVPSAASAEP